MKTVAECGRGGAPAASETGAASSGMRHAGPSHHLLELLQLPPDCSARLLCFPLQAALHAAATAISANTDLVTSL